MRRNEDLKESKDIEVAGFRDCLIESGGDFCRFECLMRGNKDMKEGRICRFGVAGVLRSHGCLID